MAENGYITTGIGFDIELYEEMEKLRAIDNFSRSQYIQSAVRHYNRKIKKQNVVDIINSLDDSQIELLKSEIKKRS